METIKLRFPNQKEGKGYDILVGSKLENTYLAQISRLNPSSIFLIYDQKLKSHAIRLERALLRRGYRVECKVLSGREKTKCLVQTASLYRALMNANVDREGLILAFGGGVISDLAGFVAGTYLRGIRWAVLPSTLLAQVDSAIGGKTGVNLPQGKNLVGVFHQPSFVCCDVSLLDTLSRRDWISGLGEMLKYGLTFDTRLFSFLVDHYRELKCNKKLLVKAVSQSVRWKTKIVSSDELERLGLRHQLNFGHTLGHVFEAITRFRKFRHGEAVLLGMRVAARLSFQKGYLKQEEQEQVERVLSRLPCPEPPEIRLSTLAFYLSRDKKSSRGNSRFVLLKKIGECILVDDIAVADISRCLTDLSFPVRDA